MKSLVIIDGFEHGMIDDITFPARNAFNFSAGMDIHTNPGILQVSKKLTAMAEADATDDITDAIRWMVKYSVNSVVYGIGGGGSGRIYDYNNTVAGKWSLVHDDVNTGKGGGMIEFNGNLHWASTTHIGKWNNSAWTDSFMSFDANDNNWHPMVIYQNKLCVGDGRYIATLATDDTWDPTALTLPVGYRIRSLAVFGNRLLIGTWKGTNIYDQPEARMFSWELGKSAYENIWTLKENGIHALAAWRNLLIVFAGTTGNIYVFNGASLNKIFEVPKILTQAGEFIEVLPGSVAEFRGNLLFGISNGSSGSSSFRGIFSLEQKTSAMSVVLISPFIISTGKTTNLIISAMFRAGSGVLYASYYDGDSTTYGVQELSTDRRIASGAYWESQIYNVSLEEYPKMITGVEIIASPLQTSNTIVIKYKLDDAASWITLGTMTSANQGLMMKGIHKIAKTVQLRLEFTTASNNNNSPKINIIKIY